MGGYHEIRSQWSLGDVMDALEYLSIQDDADYLAMKASQPKGRR